MAIGARSPGITYQELLDTDTHPVPDVLRLESPRYLGSDDIPIERYTSREWHEREVERLWKRVWQFACREEHIPDVGSYIVYDIANLSFIVIRTAPDEIKAYPNACLHRGRQLKDYDGRCSEIRCPYPRVRLGARRRTAPTCPARWDFEHIDRRRLRAARGQGRHVGRIRVHQPRPERRAARASTSATSPTHFERWDLGNRYVQGHVAKVIRGQLEDRPGGVLRGVSTSTPPTRRPCRTSATPTARSTSGTPSPGSSRRAARPARCSTGMPTEEEILRLHARHPRRRGDASSRSATARPPAPPRPRQPRERWRPVVGDGVDEWSDAEFIDNIDYTLFPNFHPWGAFNRIVYRFRPNGDDHRQAIMEVLPPRPVQGRAAAAGDDDPPRCRRVVDRRRRSSACSARCSSRTASTCPRCRRASRPTRKPGITLGNYQETKVRWLHQLLGEWVEG